MFRFFVVGLAIGVAFVAGHYFWPAALDPIVDPIIPPALDAARTPQLVPLRPGVNTPRAGDVLGFCPFTYPDKMANAKLRVVATGAAVVYIGEAPNSRWANDGTCRPMGFMLVRSDGQSRVRVRLVNEKDEVIEGYEQEYIVNAAK